MIDIDWPMHIATIECDEAACDSELEVEDVEAFEDVLSEMRIEGWRNTQRAGDWHNICPSCQEELYGAE